MNSFLQKKRRAHGKFSEDLVRRELEANGYRMVERVNTPWNVLRGPGGRIVNAFPVAKVSGDFIAIQPLTGRKVLVEVKSRDDGRFPYSMLEDHQIAALNENRVCGGHSILALVQGLKVRLLDWPVADFKPGTSLKIDSIGGKA